LAYLTGLCLTAGFTVSSLGYVIGEPNDLGNILAAQLDWPEDKKSFRLTLFSSFGILGIAIGALGAGKVVHIGRRKLTMLMCLVQIGATALTLILNLYTLCAARLILGLSAGVQLVAMSLYVSETVPDEKKGLFGFAINFGLVTGLTISLLLGFFLPGKDDPALKTTNFWKIVLGMPGAIALVNLLLWLLVFRSESLGFLVEEKRWNEAKRLVQRIYKDVNPLFLKEKVDALADETRNRQSTNMADRASAGAASKRTLGYMEVLTKPLYRRATYLCLLLALFN